MRYKVVLKKSKEGFNRQAVAGTNLELIEPRLADVFPDTESLNRALRLLVDTAEAAAGPARRRSSAPARRHRARNR